MLVDTRDRASDCAEHFDKCQLAKQVAKQVSPSKASAKASGNFQSKCKYVPNSTKFVFSMGGLPPCTNHFQSCLMPYIFVFALELATCFGTCLGSCPRLWHLLWKLILAKMIQCGHKYRPRDLPRAPPEN